MLDLQPLLRSRSLLGFGILPASRRHGTPLELNTAPNKAPYLTSLLTLTRAAVFLAAGLTTTAALADEPVASRTLQIRQSDLQGAGVNLLYKRIRLAASDVCASLDSAELVSHRIYVRCVDEAVARAVAQVNSQALTDFHLAAHGSRLPTS
jgi:UrcA family protein